MKLLDYVFSLHVTFDYNKEDQRNSTPEQQDEYDDVYRKTMFLDPFAEEDNEEFRSIYTDLLNKYISDEPWMAAAMEQDFEKEELNAYVKKFEEANRKDVPFYERLHGIDSMFMLLVPATIELYLKNHTRVGESDPIYQVNVEFEDKDSGIYYFWFEEFKTYKSGIFTAIGKSCDYHYLPREYEIINGVGIIPDSVTKIREWAFDGCTGLTSIVIPDSVTEIGEYAFDSCTGLTSIVIPDSVTEIGEKAFARCTGLTSIVIPDSVTEIGRGAFECCSGLTAIDIPSSVVNLDGFSYCTGLTSIIIPNSVTEIGMGAFNHCTGLTSVVIPDSVTEIGGDLFGAFCGCTGLQSVVIQGKMEKIGGGAFEDCTSLKTITLSAGIKKISKKAFEGCTAIERINVPAKKADYYKKRLPENLHAFIVEQ